MAFVWSGCQTIPLWSENSAEGKRQLDPPADFPRPLEVVSEVYPIELETKTINAYNAAPETEFASPYLIVLIDDEEVTRGWQDEVRRLSSLGYVVICLPNPGYEDPQENEAVWGEVLFLTVEWISRLHDTRGRKGAVIGFGDAGARALQLSLLEDRLETAVAWQPPPVVGRTMLPDLSVHWLLINPPQDFENEQFKDWATLNGLEYDFVEYEGALIDFAKPGTTSYFTADADRARAVQQRFLLEQIGSTLSPSLEEISKLNEEENNPRSQILFEESSETLER